MNLNTIILTVVGVGTVYSLLKRDLKAPVEAVVAGGKWMGGTIGEGLGLIERPEREEAKAMLWRGIKSLWGYSPTKEEVAENEKVAGFNDLKQPKAIYENIISDWQSATTKQGKVPSINDEWD